MLNYESLPYIVKARVKKMNIPISHVYAAYERSVKDNKAGVVCEGLTFYKGFILLCDEYSKHWIACRIDGSSINLGSYEKKRDIVKAVDEILQERKGFTHKISDVGLRITVYQRGSKYYKFEEVMTYDGWRQIKEAECITKDEYIKYFANGED